jgi:hypothetical protein
MTDPNAVSHRACVSRTPLKRPVARRRSNELLRWEQGVDELAAPRALDGWRKRLQRKCYSATTRARRDALVPEGRRLQTTLFPNSRYNAAPPSSSITHATAMCRHLSVQPNSPRRMCPPSVIGVGSRLMTATARLIPASAASTPPPSGSGSRLQEDPRYEERGDRAGHCDRADVPVDRVGRAVPHPHADTEARRLEVEASDLPPVSQSHDDVTGFVGGQRQPEADPKNSQPKSDLHRSSSLPKCATAERPPEPGRSPIDEMQPTQ